MFTWFFFNIHFQEKQSKLLWKSKRFYEFDVTTFLKSNLNENELENEVTEIRFQVEVMVFKNSRRKQISLEHIFDIELEKPFLFLQYFNQLSISQAALISEENSFENERWDFSYFKYVNFASIYMDPLFLLS